MAAPDASPEAGGRPSVVLGVAGGIAAYKACELLRRFTETGHDVTVVPTPSALHFVGEATWAGAVRQAGAHPGLGVGARGAARAHRPVRRPRRRRSRDRRPAGPGRARPRRRPAHQRPAHRPLPGGLRPGDAHRDVGARRHPGERRDAAAAWRPRDRARGRPTHRCRLRQGQAARARRDLRDLPGRARPRRGGARPGRPHRRRVRGWHPRAARPGALPRQPVVRSAGRRPGARGRGHGAPR